MEFRKSAAPSRSFGDWSACYAGTHSCAHRYGGIFMLSLNTNTAALIAQAANQVSTREAARGMQQLATGKRINSAADDAAGLAISTRLTSQIRGVAQAIRNANDGIALIQTADAAAGSMVSLFQRMRELRVQYDNDTNNPADKTSILSEIKSLKAEISNVVTNAAWNGISLFDGGGSNDARNFNLNINGDRSVQSQLSVQTPNLLQTIGINPHSETVSFSAPTTSTTGFFDQTVATADFNGDGNADLVTAETVSRSISVLLGNGDGVFQTETFSTSSRTPASVVAGDFNGDEKMDIITTNQDGSISSYFGYGDGTFEQPRFSSYPSSAQSLSSSDLNSDGKPDLIIGNSGSSIFIALNKGDGTFDPSIALPTGGAPCFAAVADLNKNGKNDIVVSNAFNNNISVLIANGDGTYKPQVTYTVGSSPYGITTADLNGDGTPDILVSNYGSRSISVLVGNGDGSFTNSVAYNIGVQAQAITTVDLNNDGKVDVIAANTASAGVTVLQGNGDGTFKAPTIFAAGNQPIAVVTADFNNDHKPDIAVANYLSSQVSVALNSSPYTFWADNPTMDQIDGYLTTVSQARAGFGAAVSSLNYTVDYLTSMSMNLQQSRSRIEDTDHSEAITALTKSQIIQKASMAMLAQANQMPQMVLQLIKASM